MKILVTTDYDKLENKYLKQGEEMVEITSYEDTIFIELEHKLLRIPKQVFFGIMNN
jgi:hypothetical protein